MPTWTFLIFAAITITLFVMAMLAANRPPYARVLYLSGGLAATAILFLARVRTDIGFNAYLLPVVFGMGAIALATIAIWSMRQREN